MIATSLGVSGDGLVRIGSGVATLPMSWNRAPRSMAGSSCWSRPSAPAIDML